MVMLQTEKTIGRPNEYVKRISFDWQKHITVILIVKPKRVVPTLRACDDILEPGNAGVKTLKGIGQQGEGVLHSRGYKTACLTGLRMTCKSAAASHTVVQVVDQVQNNNKK